MALLVLVHLSVVGIAILTNLLARSPSKADAAIWTYLNLTGTIRDYGFFAPSVASDIKVAFAVEGDSESSILQFNSNNHEIAFRYNSVISSCMREERGRVLFAQSWAALILGSHPNAATVTVMAKAQELPTMAEFQRGRRPAWKMVYAGTFRRRHINSH